MTPQQAEIVKKSFPKVLAGTLSATQTLYDKLFELAPDTRNLFKNTPSGAAISNACCRNREVS